MEYLHKELTYKIRGACFNVYNNLGPGFSESIYQKALVCEFEKINIDFEREKLVVITYDDKEVGRQRLDLVVEERVIIEIKAVSKVVPIFEYQLLAYLKATKLRVGLLVNFGEDKLYIKRYVN